MTRPAGRSLLAHRGAAALWTVLTVPALLWWRDAVWFVITASLWANVYAALAAMEGADDRRVLDRLDRLDRQLAELLDPSRRPDDGSPAPEQRGVGSLAAGELAEPAESDTFGFQPSRIRLNQLEDQ